MSWECVLHLWYAGWCQVAMFCEMVNRRPPRVPEWRQGALL